MAGSHQLPGPTRLLMAFMPCCAQPRAKLPPKEHKGLAEAQPQPEAGMSQRQQGERKCTLRVRATSGQKTQPVTKGGGVPVHPLRTQCSLRCRSSPSPCPTPDAQDAPAQTLQDQGAFNPLSAKFQQKIKVLLGKPLCSRPWGLCPCNITLQLPSTQPPSQLCCSSRGPSPCPELFLPPAREMSQCLALPMSPRELLLSSQLGREEGAAHAPSPPRRPPTLHQLKSHVRPFPLCLAAFPQLSQPGSPGSSTPAWAIQGQTHLNHAGDNNASPSSLAEAGRRIPEQETSCL